MELTNKELEMIEEVANELISNDSAWLNTYNHVELKAARGYEPETELFVKLALERGIDEGKLNEDEFIKLNDEFHSKFFEALYDMLKRKLED